MGILQGLLQGVLEAPLQQQEQEQQINFENRRRAINLITNQIENVREEDFPHALEELNTILNARNPKEQEAAIGRFYMKMQAEDYQGEEMTKMHNQAIGEQAGASGRLRIATNLGRNAELSNPQGMEARSVSNPNVIRLKTSEGEMGRKLKLYEGQQQLMQERQLAVEGARAKAAVEKERLRLQTLGVRKLSEGLDADGNTVLTYEDRETGQIKQRVITGVTPTGAVIAHERLSTQEEQAAKMLEQRKFEFESMQRLRKQELEIDSAYKQAQADKLRQEVLDAQSGRSKAQRDTTEAEIKSIMDEYKTANSTLLDEIESTFTQEKEVQGNIALSNLKKVQALDELRGKREKLEERRLKIWKDVESKIKSLRGEKGELKKAVGKLVNKSVNSTPSASPSSPTSSRLKVGEARSIFGNLNKSIPAK